MPNGKYIGWTLSVTKPEWRVKLELLSPDADYSGEELVKLIRELMDLREGIRPDRAVS